MLSQELVDIWFLCPDYPKKKLRDIAKQSIIDSIVGDVLDKNHPQEALEVKSSEKILLKRVGNTFTLTTHLNKWYYGLFECVDCKIISLKGNKILLQNMESEEIFICDIKQNLNFFSAVRILEYIEQGKFIQ